MTLSVDELRCQGRTARSAVGHASLVDECWDCQRRTDIPAEVKLKWYSEPPQLVRIWNICPAKVDPEVTIYG